MAPGGAFACEARGHVIVIAAAATKPVPPTSARREGASTNMPFLHSQSSNAAISLACASVMASPMPASAASIARVFVPMWSEWLNDMRFFSPQRVVRH